MKLARLLLILMALVAMVACTPKSSDQEGGAFRHIDAAELARILEEQPDVLVVNVHVPYEGEIPGTDAHIPYDTISLHLDELSPKSDTLVLYCRSGSMSTAAAQELAELGYSNVLELEGGMRAWEAAGYSLTFD